MVESSKALISNRLNNYNILDAYFYTNECYRSYVCTSHQQQVHHSNLDPLQVIPTPEDLRVRQS